MDFRRLRRWVGGVSVATGIALVLPLTVGAAAAHAVQQAPGFILHTPEFASPALSNAGALRLVPLFNASSMTDANGGLLLPGDTVDVARTIFNSGDSETTDVVMSDDLTNLSGITNVSIDGGAPAAGTVTVSATNLTVRLGVGAGVNGGTLPAGASVTVSYSATVVGAPAGNTATSSATLFYTGGSTGPGVLALPIESPASVPDLSVSKSHTGNFTQGGTGSYTIGVSNAAAAGPTSGTVTVTDTLPAGVTPASVSGTGWTCNTAGQTITCVREDALAPGANYPPITVTANITATAPCTFSNTATVSGGGSASASDSDPTTVTGGTCNSGGGGGGGSILPINVNGILTMFNNISTNNNINSPHASNDSRQGFNTP